MDVNLSRRELGISSKENDRPISKRLAESSGVAIQSPWLPTNGKASA